MKVYKIAIEDQIILQMLFVIDMDLFWLWSLCLGCILATNIIISDQKNFLIILYSMLDNKLCIFRDRWEGWKR